MGPGLGVVVGGSTVSSSGFGLSSGVTVVVSEFISSSKR